ncbi:MAG: DUF4270 family protein [Ferruginibacter sp.]
MNKRILSLTLTGFLIIILLDWSCTKLDTTNIGSDLIPAVDNINTFADTFAINTTQGVFVDTTKLTVSNTLENYVFGKTDDPLMGRTDAALFLQLKPNFYPYYIGSPGDTIVHLDSIVLCLSYKGAYGDTANTPITLQVNSVPSNIHGDWDSLTTPHNVNYAPVLQPYGTLLGTRTFTIQSLGSYQFIGKGKDSVINQIRVKLTEPIFVSGFAEADSIYNFGIYSRDSLFRAFNNGFVVSMTQGNALLYTQLSDPSTRLELHYKRKNGTAVLSDTSWSYFSFNNGSGGSAAPRRCAVADHIVRTRNPLPTPGDQEIYLQTDPGTYANLKIPQLTGYSNRIIHRAEIIMEEIPGDPVADGYFPEPGYLYLDLVDSGTSKWKPIYFDLNPSYAYDPDYKNSAYYFPGNNVVDYTYFGGTPKQITDATAPSGKRAQYAINVTRYVQQIVTKQTPNYEMRLFAPYNIIYPQYKPDVIPYSNSIANGRVRLGGGNAVDPKYRMRLRIIYSKLK